MWNATKDGLGLTQAQAAQRLGMSQSAFSQILSGTVAVNSVMALNITALLGADLQKLCAGLDEYEHLVKIRPVTGCLLPVTLTITGKKITNTSIQSMINSEGAFAVEIDSEEYRPRYKPGDYAVVTPHADINIGDEILIHFKKTGCLIRVVDTIDGDRVGVHHPTLPGSATEINLDDPKINMHGVIKGVSFG